MSTSFAQLASFAKSYFVYRTVRPRIGPLLVSGILVCVCAPTNPHTHTENDERLLLQGHFEVFTNLELMPSAVETYVSNVFDSHHVCRWVG